jgi:hypothetical protein
MSDRVTIRTASGKTETVCRPDMLGVHHLMVLEEVERLRDLIRRAYEGDPDDLYSEGAKMAVEELDRSV